MDHAADQHAQAFEALQAEEARIDRRLRGVRRRGRDLAGGCVFAGEPAQLLRLERNDLEALQQLFTFESDNMRSGTGEVRAWISAAAAMNRPAKFVEYVAAHSTQTGCGFVYWPEVSAENGA